MAPGAFRSAPAMSGRQIRPTAVGLDEGDCGIQPAKPGEGIGLLRPAPACRCCLGRSSGGLGLQAY